MKALLHIPSGELVEFYRLTYHGQLSILGGLYVVRLANEASSLRWTIPEAKFKNYLDLHDNISILISTVCTKLKTRHTREEFEVIDI